MLRAADVSEHVATWQAAAMLWAVGEMCVGPGGADVLGRVRPHMRPLIASFRRALDEANAQDCVNVAQAIDRLGLGREEREVC